MITVTDLSSLIGISKERTKQLVDQYITEHPNHDVDKSGKAWIIGPDTVKALSLSRGKKFPDKKVVTFAALKGGIGKTTLSTNVAVRAASYGIKVLLIDVDPEACATNSLIPDSLKESSALKCMHDVFIPDSNISIEQIIVQSKYKNLDIIPSFLRNHKVEKLLSNKNPKKVMKEKIDKLPYNLIFLELPPSFTTLTGAAYLAADLIVLPCTPNIYSLESIALTIEAVDKLCDEFECPERNYKIIMNQYNSKRIASQEVINALIEDYKSKVLPFYIKDSADIANATNSGLTIFESKCPKDLKNNFDELTQFVCDHLGTNS